jgi:murein L,D-transpeptidase YcbB/YkuD
VQARALVQTLRDAQTYGLRAQDYAAEPLAAQIARLDAAAESSADLAAFGSALSAAARALVHDLHFGRIDPAATGFDIPRREPAFDYGATIEQLASDDPAAVIARIEPQLLHYRLLKEALLRYLQLAAEPGLTALPSPGAAAIKPGQRYVGAPALRALLAATGDLSAADAAGTDTVLDPNLVTALKRFQNLHGLDEDGALGRATFAALTVPLSQRMRSIELTLERMRWLPAIRAPTLIINIPQFRLYLLKSDRDREADMLRMNVIVGQEYPSKYTPVFAADIESIVFRPFWDVPPSIARNELVPLLRRKPDYLAAEHMQIVRNGGDSEEPLPPSPMNLDAVAAGNLRLRHRPGSDNALGLIKFVLPNPYGVYLHSTPAPQLFARPRRSFSHGCIRVSDPEALAVEVLRGTPGDWTLSNVQAAMNGDTTRTVRLAHPMHVLVLYGTAIASEDGAVHFFDDVYGHDRRLAALLAASHRNVSAAGEL